MPRAPVALFCSAVPLSSWSWGDRLRILNIQVIVHVVRGRDLESRINGAFLFSTASSLELSAIFYEEKVIDTLVSLFAVGA